MPALAPAFNLSVGTVLKGAVTTIFFVACAFWIGKCILYTQIADLVLTRTSQIVQNPYRKNLLRLARRNPNSAVFKISKCEDISWQFRKRGHFLKAKQSYEEALQISDLAFGEASESSVNLLTEIAWCDENYGLFKLAEIEFRNTLSYSARWLGEKHSCTDRLRLCLAYLLERQGRLAEAEILQEKRYQILGAEGAFCLQNLARIYEKEGKLDRAEETYRKSSRRGRADDLFYADFLLRQHNLAQAEAIYLRMSQKKASTNGFEIALARFYAKSGNTEAGIQTLHSYMQSINLSTTDLENVDFRTVPNCSEQGARLVMAELLESKGRYNQASRVLNAYLSEVEKAIESNFFERAFILDWLGHLAFLECRKSEAIDLYQRALDIRLIRLSPKHPDVGESYRNLAKLYLESGDNERSIALNNKSLEAYRQGLTWAERREQILAW